MPHPRWISVFVGCVVAVSCGDAEIPLAVDDFADRVDDTRYIYDELSASERDCVFRREAAELDADLIVNGVGVRADAERTKAVQISLDCVDDPAAWNGWVQFQASNFAAGVGLGIELTEAEGQCLISYLLDSASDPARLFAVGDGVDDIAVAVDAVEVCFGEANLALFYGETVAFDAYGDDPELDQLHDACQTGSPESCDLLFLQSGLDSEYEAFAASCGETVVAVGELCSGVQVDRNGFALPADAAFADLGERCGAGDGLACDLYFRLGEPGSEEEDFGFTCGGAIPLGGFPDCRTAMADS